MKKIVSILTGCAISFLLTSCTTTTLPPNVPREVRLAAREYLKLPDNKAFVLAIDPSGSYAYAHSDSMETIDKAKTEASTICEKIREKNKVHANIVVYAINNKVVYKEMYFSNQ